MKIVQSMIPATAGISHRDPVRKGLNPSPTGGTSFSDILKKSVEGVNALQKQADVAIDDLVLGGNKDIVQTMIAVEKADISFRLMMRVRSKIMQAYEEIMRMQV